LLKISFICAVMRILLSFILLLGLSCTVARRGSGYYRNLNKEIRQSLVFSKAFTGFALMDAQTGAILCSDNADRYFTPASNTKILTLSAALAALGDSIPGFRYAVSKDTLFVVPEGDPTFLNPYFAAWQSGYHFIKSHPAKYIIVCDQAPALLPFGPGWMWDDFNSEYSPERSVWPIYSNLRRIVAVKPDSLAAEPPYWNRFLIKSDLDSSQIRPEDGQNTIFYARKSNFSANFEEWIPVHDAKANNRILIEDTLHKSLIFRDIIPNNQEWNTWKSTPADTVYRRLMHQSDNFIAEQLLLMSAAAKTGKFERQNMIDWMKNNNFSNLPFPPRWVDGSGLSRYNMNTPLSNVQILLQLWKSQPHERLFSLFPAGGVSGTIATLYAGADQQPYIFAKTGSMTGVHCLSGYLLTKRNKVLIFSFMHNNFVGSSKPWKEEMQRILAKIRSDL